MQVKVHVMFIGQSLLQLTTFQKVIFGTSDSDMREK